MNYLKKTESGLFNNKKKELFDFPNSSFFDKSFYY